MEGRQMEYRTLGKTGLRVSAVGVGCWQMGGVVDHRGWTGVTDEESIAIIHRARELGVNLLDTAEAYGGGHSEEVIGRAITGMRDDFVISSKVRPLVDDCSDEEAKTRVREACEGSLQRLNTDFLDLYLLHAEPFEPTQSAVIAAFEELREQGKIKAFGISTNDIEISRTLMTYGDLSVLEVGYSLLELETTETLAFAAENELGTLIRKPLASGTLTGKYFGLKPELETDDLRYGQLNSDHGHEVLEKLKDLLFLTREGERSMVQAALRYILDTEGVTAVIPGAKSRQQLEDNVGAADTPQLTQEERDRALEIAQQIGPFRAF